MNKVNVTIGVEHIDATSAIEQLESQPDTICQLEGHLKINGCNWHRGVFQLSVF